MKPVIVCMRVEDAVAARVVVPGSRSGRCGKCGEEVILAPSSVSFVRDTGASVQCVNCTTTNTVPAEVHLAAGALTEIADHFGVVSRKKGVC